VTRGQILDFVRAQRFAVQASATGDSAPQAAAIGFVATDAFELFFDTLDSARKCVNLRGDPRIALVIGWDDRTVQYEGVADEPHGAELARLKQLYLARFPDGIEREAWHHLLPRPPALAALQ
jgi:hypothetical protein